MAEFFDAPVTSPQAEANSRLCLPRIERALFNPETISFIRDMLDHRPGPTYRTSTNKGRASLSNPPELLRLHGDLSRQGPTLFGEAVFPTYIFVARYGPQGILPPHTDRPSCEWTIGYCVRQDAVWPFMIEDESYALNESEAILYSGTRNLHWRDPIVGTFCDMILFHFVPTKRALAWVRAGINPRDVLKDYSIDRAPLGASET